jgi:hypothetical protein
LKYQRAFIEEDSLCFLSGQRKIHLDMLRRYICARETDTVILAGTLVEGYGNPLSDFDVYVIGDERPSLADVDSSKHHWIYGGADNNSMTTGGTGALHQIFDYIPGEDLACDTEYWTWSDVRTAIEAVDEARTLLFGHGFRASSLSARQAEFLHKVSNGLILQGKEAFDQTFAKFSVPAYCYVQYRQYAGGYPNIRDIRGAWIVGEYDLAVYLTRSHLHDQLMSLTFLEMLTNYNMKWIFKKVQELPPACSQIVASFSKLNSADLRTDEDKKAYILESLDLMDMVYDRCRILLDSNPAFQGTEEGIEIVKKVDLGRAADHPEFRRQQEYRMKIFMSGRSRCRDFVLRQL